jgi:DNA helicase-2/ATP-dependent DNA helicase PcrA
VAGRAAGQLTGLAAAYARLDDGQREAVDSEVSTVVIAGPGSGKTETLAVKAAILLQEIPAPRGVACITYTRAAAQEIRARVVELGVRPERRLVSSTLHAFCLRQILRPYASLAGEPGLADREVVGSRAADELREQACREAGAGVWLSEADLQTVRRALAAGVDAGDRFTKRHEDAARRYDRHLADQGLTDFDGMVHEALRLVQEHPVVVELTAARFPWILVDEYQDLGAPLHVLVQALRDEGGIDIFAVGDPDQTIMQFTGADAEYIESLEAEGYHPVVLPINYRCAPSIVRAVARAAARDRGYKPDPRRQNEGEVIPREVGPGMRQQMEVVTGELLPAMLQRFPAHEIAILYPYVSWYMDRITDALRGAGVDFSLERDTRFPRKGEVVGWLQRCAQWSIDAFTERRGGFRELADELREYLVDAGDLAGRTALAAAELLYPVLEDAVEPDAPLAPWLEGLVDALGLDELLARGGEHGQDAEALADLRRTAARRDLGLTVQDLAGPVRRPGRVVVTTYHSAKGREFDAVILPGLQNGIIPGKYKKGGQWRGSNVDHQLKLFYVAVTRARHTLALLWSPLGENRYGDDGQWPVSPFVGPLLEQIDAEGR